MKTLFLALCCIIAFVRSDDTTSTDSDSNEDYKPPSIAESQQRISNPDLNDQDLQNKGDNVGLSDADTQTITTEAEQDYATYKAALDALALIPSTSPTDLLTRLTSKVREVQNMVTAAQTAWNAALQQAQNSAAQRITDLQNEVSQRQDLIDKLQNAEDSASRVQAAAATIAANLAAAQKDWEAAKDWIASKAAEIQTTVLNKYQTLVGLVKADLTSVPPTNPTQDPAVVAAYQDLHSTVVDAKTAAQRVLASLAVAEAIAERADEEAKALATALQQVQQDRASDDAQILQDIQTKFGDNSTLGDIKRRLEVMCGTTSKDCVQQTNSDSVGVTCNNVVPDTDNGADDLKKCFKAVLGSIGIHDEDTSVDATAAQKRQSSSGYTVSATAAPNAQGNSSSGGGGLTKADKAGIVIGCVAGVAILVIIAALVMKKKDADYV